MALTYAQLVAPAAYDQEADPDGFKAARLAVKQTLLTRLNDVGVVGVWSWTTGSVPSSLVEVYAWSLLDIDVSRAFIAQGGLNSDAEDDALDTWAEQVYDNTRFPGLTTVARVKLTDAAGAGPYTFNPASVSFTVGRGGLRFDGFDFTGLGNLTLPQSGTVYVYVRAEDKGSKYSTLSVGAVNYFARGALPGVTVTNDSTWLTFSGAVAGTDDESDAALRARNVAKWGTLGTGSPASAYETWALEAQPTQVTRVAPLTNIDLLDPGRIDVILAGPAGAVDPGVVAAVQAYIAPNEVGGERIPATARCVVSSAANLTINVTATLRVQSGYNTSAFQAQVSADFASFAAATPIGGGQLGFVDWQRMLGVLVYRAGLNPGIILDVSSFSPSADVALLYYQVPVFSLTLTWVSV